MIGRYVSQGSAEAGKNVDRTLECCVCGSSAYCVQCGIHCHGAAHGGSCEKYETILGQVAIHHGGLARHLHYAKNQREFQMEAIWVVALRKTGDDWIAV